ncbi:flagellar filament capping protein FliD [Ideonella sp.]|jgi:flagellar hook-associated protein 2|uniref:flagellar filament capping protein FliD n=1 Tax=Ideonella sp. TaxID=1929293 RepID=UPI0037BF3A47
MPAITSLGVGSGLDAEGIVSSLMAVERRPISLVQTQIDGLNTKMSSIGKLKSLVAAMRDKAAALTSTTAWGKMAVSTSDATSVSASAAANSPAGRYSVTVQSLAAAQTITSGQFANSSATLNEGSLTIELGSYQGSGTPATGFTAKPGATPVTINIGAGETSLSAIRDKINAAGAGVTASIVNDANGARLSLRSTATGEVNGFRITAAETTDDGAPGTGLSALAFNATTLTSPMALNQRSANAQATINGIVVNSTTNTFAEVADGLTVTVSKVNATPVELVTSQDTASIKTSIDEFIKAYNEMAVYLRDQTKVEAATGSSTTSAGNTNVVMKGGPLQGDRSAVDLQWQLRSVINESSSTSSQWSALSQIGIVMKQDGTLETKSTELTAALAKPDELRKLLATDGSSSANSGFMDRFRDVGDRVLSFEGSLEVRGQYLQKNISRLGLKKTDMEDRLTSKEENLRARYQSLDTQMSRLSALQQYVTQQLSSLNTSA